MLHFCSKWEAMRVPQLKIPPVENVAKVRRFPPLQSKRLPLLLSWIRARGQRSHTSVSILSRFPSSLPLLSPPSLSRPCLTLSLPAPAPPSQVVFNWGGGADGRRTSAPLSLAALWWGEGWRWWWWWWGVRGVQRRVLLSFLPLSISNPAVVSNKHTPAHASEHTRSRARAGVFSLNWVLQCVQSKDEGKNTGVARGERRTLQGEFDFHIILPAHTH